MNAAAAYATSFSMCECACPGTCVIHICVHADHFYVYVYLIASVCVVCMRYITYILWAYLKRKKKTSNGKNLLHCEIS